jgi:hypothetical protein
MVNARSLMGRRWYSRTLQLHSPVQLVNLPLDLAIQYQLNQNLLDFLLLDVQLLYGTRISSDPLLLRETHPCQKADLQSRVRLQQIDQVLRAQGTEYVIDVGSNEGVVQDSRLVICDCMSARIAMLDADDLLRIIFSASKMSRCWYAVTRLVMATICGFSR